MLKIEYPVDDDGVEVKNLPVYSYAIVDPYIRHHLVVLVIHHRILESFYAHDQVVGQLRYVLSFF